MHVVYQNKTDISRNTSNAPAHEAYEQQPVFISLKFLIAEKVKISFIFTIKRSFVVDISSAVPHSPG
mgnify:CR=1 FL=1